MDQQRIPSQWPTLYEKQTSIWLHSLQNEKTHCQEELEEYLRKLLPYNKQFSLLSNVINPIFFILKVNHDIIDMIFNIILHNSQRSLISLHNYFLLRLLLSTLFLFLLLVLLLNSFLFLIIIFLLLFNHNLFIINNSIPFLNDLFLLLNYHLLLGSKCLLPLLLLRVS